MQETEASTPEKIVIEGHLSGYEPSELFTFWTDPDKVVQWWPAVASIDPRVGGTYEFSWPEMDWHLRGNYILFDPAGRLGFTWKWDHDPPGHSPHNVDVLVVPHPDGGSRMTISHGPFSLEDADARQGILEGWLHFGMKLAGLKPGSG